MYLHVTTLILLSYFLNFFRSVQDISHIHSEFFTLYLISANGISCIPSPHSSVFLLYFCALYFSYLSSQFYSCIISSLCMAFQLHFLLYSPCTISFLHIAALCAFHFWFHIWSTWFLFMLFTLFFCLVLCSLLCMLPLAVPFCTFL